MYYPCGSKDSGSLSWEASLENTLKTLLQFKRKPKTHSIFDLRAKMNDVQHFSSPCASLICKLDTLNSVIPVVSGLPVPQNSDPMRFLNLRF